MGIYIEHIRKSDGQSCEFCGDVIQNYKFGLTFYRSINSDEKENPFEYLFNGRNEYKTMDCCAGCAGIVTGEDTAERVKVRTEYDERFADFCNKPWAPTSNPLVVTKIWRGRSIGIMKDKFGRRKFGVLFGKAERWQRREKRSQYERIEDISISDMRMAEYIAFCWMEFTEFYQVSPEDSYSVSQFHDLANYFHAGLLPEDKPQERQEWWQT